METWSNIYHLKRSGIRSYPTYEEWKQQEKCGVMVYENIRSYPTYEEWKLFLHATIVFLTFVLILPMRNGNKDCIEEEVDMAGCSYPTYEEWKRSCMMRPKSNVLSSYPTYEEWKPEYLMSLSEEEEKVLILPMRNGNKVKQFFLGPYIKVLILPMRNGNYLSSNICSTIFAN